MSSKPGDTMEDFLAWQLDIVVENHGEANVSLGIAEALGNVLPRRRLSWKQFQFIVVVCEPLREDIERQLREFDEETSCSWRDYCAVFEDYYPDEIDKWCRDYLKALASN